MARSLPQYYMSCMYACIAQHQINANFSKDEFTDRAFVMRFFSEPMEEADTETAGNKGLEEKNNSSTQSSSPGRNLIYIN